MPTASPSSPRPDLTVILTAHNAHLTQISSAPVINDPVLNCETATPAIAKWQGDCQALLRDQTIEEVRGNMRILMREVLVDLPNNLPYEPTNNDLLTFTVNTGEMVTLEVRQVNREYWGLGHYRYVCRRQ
jgi:hypothetical protein